MKPQIDPEFESYLRPLTELEAKQLREAMSQGWDKKYPIILWGETIIDGHNRYKFAQELRLKPTFEQKEFPSREAVLAWMLENQLKSRAGRGGGGNRGLDELWAVMNGLPYGVDIYREDARELWKLEPKTANRLIRKGGIVSLTVAGARRRLKERNASRNAESLSPVPIPDDMRLKGTTVVLDEEGNTSRTFVKTERARPETFMGVPDGEVVKGRSINIDGQGQISSQWIKTDKEKSDVLKAFTEACETVAARLLGGTMKPTPPPKVTLSDLLCVYPLGDPHIGLMSWGEETGENHDLSIGCQDLLTAFDLLVDTAPDAETAMLLNLGDYFHADDAKQITPGHGHKLDVDGRHPKVFAAGVEVMVRGVERLLKKHKQVHIANLPGNHDPGVCTALAMAVKQAFRNEPRVIANVNPSPHQVLEFGRNMIVTSHGDGVKRDDMAKLAASRWPEIWGRTRYRVAYTGHIHHETRKELSGLTVESFRTLAGKDAWHSAKGYDAGRSLDVITHHKHYGPMSRSTIDIDMIRDAQARSP